MDIRSCIVTSLMLPALFLATAMAQDGALEAPQISQSEVVVPVTAPYPDADLAAKQVEEAFVSAAKSHRKVMLIFGGNWCPDCRILAGILDVPALSQWLDSQFIIVPVNVGHLDRNLEIASAHHVAITEVPSVLVFSSGRKLLNPHDVTALGDARKMTVQSVVNLLNQWNNRE